MDMSLIQEILDELLKALTKAPKSADTFVVLSIEAISDWRTSPLPIRNRVYGSALIYFRLCHSRMISAFTGLATAICQVLPPNYGGPLSASS